MPDPTTNYGWNVPAVGGDNNAWGTLLNAVFDDIDGDLATVAGIAAAASAKTDSLTTAGIFGVQTLYKYISYAAFVPKDIGDDMLWGAGARAYLALDNISGAEAFCSVEIPQGCTITQVDLICDKNGLTSVTATLYGVDATTGVVGTEGTGTRSAAGVGAASITGLAVLVGAYFYTLGVQIPSPGTTQGRIYGAKVTYTRPNIGKAG